ncbi:MAG: sigma-54 dependent transcriptional regulator [Holosporaceae bacterium]|jgi:DNA-binding NtrC family response regulator|nr:sigma-54 dependent transcriptional regulator [Holosporaceae bacterium]
MRIIVVGEKLERSLYEIIEISKTFNCPPLFFKKEIKTQLQPDDVVIIDGDLTRLLPKDSQNTVVSVATSPNYAPSLKNEVVVNLLSIHSIEKIIKKGIANRFAPIAVDPATKSVFKIADKIAATNASVLITGETGTGKEVLAKYIYQKSDRSSQNYVTVNCAAIPETLLESELFGHEKGAFTNAIQRRIGKFEEAGRGTILLDEISEIPLGLQAKLLRAIQEKEFSRLGGNGIVKSDFRVIATSNRNLRREVENGSFREDLFYRLNVIAIEMPKLNDRPLDIEPLAKFFCEKYSDGRKTLSDRFIASAQEREWKGNVRELENFVHRSVLLSSDQIVDDFSLIQNQQVKTLRQIERETILRTMKKFNGNKTLVSKKLGVSLRSLHYKLDSYAESA